VDKLYLYTISVHEVQNNSYLFLLLMRMSVIV